MEVPGESVLGPQVWSAMAEGEPPDRSCAGCWAMQPFCTSPDLHSHLEGSNFMETEGGAGCPGNQLCCLNSSANHPRHLGGGFYYLKCLCGRFYSPAVGEYFLYLSLFLLCISTKSYCNHFCCFSLHLLFCPPSLSAYHKKLQLKNSFAF